MDAFALPLRAAQHHARRQAAAPCRLHGHCRASRARRIVQRAPARAKRIEPCEWQCSRWRSHCAASRAISVPHTVGGGAVAPVACGSVGRPPVTLYCADCSSAPHEGLNRPSAGRRQSDSGTTRTGVLCPSAAQRPNGYSDSGGAFVRALRHRTRALRGPCRCARSNLWCWCAARHGVDLPLLQVEDVPAMRREPQRAQHRNRYDCRRNFVA